MPSMRSHGSSSRRSSTPQVKAPCAPPPCSAKSTRTGAWCDVAVLVVIPGHRYAELGMRRTVRWRRRVLVSRESERASLAQVLCNGGDYDDKFHASNGQPRRWVTVERHPT